MLEAACPSCGSFAVVPIRYGKPNEEGMAAASRGEVILGGCAREGNAPNSSCQACGKRF